MPPVRKTGGWHLPGYNYCGPFSNLEAGKHPVNDLDECCYEHDLNYDKPDKSTREADDELLDCVERAGGSRIISGVFKAKRHFDEATNYASDKILRGSIGKSVGSGNTMSGRGNKRSRSIGERRRIDQYYQNKKKRQESANNEEDCEEEIDDGQGEPAQAAQMSADGGAGGSGGGGGNAELENEIPWGIRPSRYFMKFKKSYQVYVSHGLDSTNYGWRSQGIANYNGWHVEHCEGFAIIPWGSYITCMSRMEWNQLHMTSRRWRPVQCSVTIDDIIPFQETVTSAGVSFSNVAFTNKPNLHIYVDDSHLLPRQNWTLDDVAHNSAFSVPYSDYNDASLKIPKFKLYGMDPNQWRCKEATIPNENEPQKLWTLYNTGKVTQIHPGEKFHYKHKVMQAGWYGARGVNDFRSDVVIDVSRLGWSDAANTHSVASMVECNGTQNSHHDNAVPETQFLTTSGTPTLGAVHSQNQYMMDTQNAIPWKGVPYILIKSEPYAQPTGGYMKIYHQFHLHYETTVEVESAANNGYGQAYDPTQYNDFRNTSTIGDADHDLARALTVGAMDNTCGRIRPPQTTSLFYI